MKIALEQARDGRLHILGEMAKALTSARGDVATTAPRITIINVPKEKIREIIGTGGKVIREIVEQTKCKIDIDDDGTIKIAATDTDQAQQAIDWIRGIVAEPEIGVIYTGKVVKTADFGAFVNFLGSKDGLVHISELAQGRVAKTTDVVNNGDTVKVKVIGFDERGKVKLSMRVVDQATGADITEQVGARPPRGERPDREERGDRGDRGRSAPRPRPTERASHRRFEGDADQPPSRGEREQTLHRAGVRTSRDRVRRYNRWTLRLSTVGRHWTSDAGPCARRRFPRTGPELHGRTWQLGGLATTKSCERSTQYGWVESTSCRWWKAARASPISNGLSAGTLGARRRCRHVQRRQRRQFRLRRPPHPAALSRPHAA